MDRYLTTSQVSTLTGYSSKTLANLRSQRRGPRACKNGKSVRYKESEVNEWMEKHFSPIPMVNDRKIPVEAPRSERLSGDLTSRDLKEIFSGKQKEIR